MANAHVNFIKIKTVEANLICQNFSMSDDAKLILNKEVNSSQFMMSLYEKKLYPDTVKFLAHALPKREAIWWAYLCAEEAEDDNSEEVITTLEIIKKWVYHPDEILRRAAEASAKKLEYKTATSWVAMAVFWSGGSISPPENPHVLPPDALTGHAVAGAVMLAAAINRQKEVTKNYEHYLEQAMNIASGGDGEI